MERLTGLIALAWVASHGGYTAVARELPVSPRAVSKGVQRLEQQLGLSLFTRTTRSLTLTSGGRDLHERALRRLRDAEEIEQVALTARAEPSGTLTVTASLPIGVHVLGTALPRFWERYPQLSVDVRLGDRIVDIIVGNIGMTIRVGELADSRLMSRRLAPNRACTLAPPAYLARRGTPQHPDELVKHDCVNFRLQNSGQLLRWSLRICARMIEITPEVDITADSSNGVLAVLAAGGGIGSRPRTSPYPLSPAANWCRSLQSLPSSDRASRPCGPRAGPEVRT